MIRSFFLISSLWATLFGDIGCLPCAAQSVPLSVDSLFRLIDDRSRIIDLKSLGVEEAREGENVARSQRLPMLDASLSVGYLGNGYLTDRDFGNGMAIRNPHSNNNFALEAMQVIYSGGAISNGIRMAGLNARLAELDLEKSRQEVRFLLLGWLVDLHCLHNRRRVLDEHIVLARQVLDDMRTRYEEGVVLSSDITRYELQLANLLLQREKTAEAIRTTDHRLANTLVFPTDSTRFIPHLPPLETDFSIGGEIQWQDRAQASNLSLRQAELGIEISETARRLAAAGKRPQIALFAYGRFDSPIVTEVPVIDKNMMYWGFGVRLSFRISSLYTADKQVRRARIAEQGSIRAYDLGVEQVRNDVQAAYEACKTAETELRTQEKSLELARQNYAVVRDRFDNGMALITDLVDAANVRLASEIGLEDSRTMLLFSYYRLKYVTHTL